MLKFAWGLIKMSSALKKLTEIVNDLPAESQAEVIDFAEFLREKKRRQIPEKLPQKERVFGQYDGQGFISDDFNDYLGDEFWFGEDFGIIEKNNESADWYTYIYLAANRFGKYFRSENPNTEKSEQHSIFESYEYLGDTNKNPN